MSIRSKLSSAIEIELTKISDTDELMGRAYLIIHTRPDGRTMAIIEDVFTETQFRKRGVASDIIDEAVLIADRYNCYKVILTCTDDNVQFYKKFGFSVNQNAMRLALGDT